MKNALLFIISLLFLGFISCSDGLYDEQPASVEVLSLSQLEGRKGPKPIENTDPTGNGAPAGSHYTLNLIGVPKDKSADMTNNSGSRIFVKLDGKSRIYLNEGDFQVLDANGTDGRAEFSLPAPDADGDGTTDYLIVARPLGKPGGKSTLTTCATYVSTDLETGETLEEEVCSLNSVFSMRMRGNQKFTNVTQELTEVEAAFRDIDGDGDIDEDDIEVVNLFDELLQDYLWDYDNEGLKVLQLRFYKL